ncbi:MAG: hypothetical protein FJW83_10310 [Actinobacteria bacterium]|nr:hypothetical protein [Actinomycetota bacterium]
MATTRPSAPVGVNHLVLNVRDLEASHRFYTEFLGFEQCGALAPEAPVEMRFYRSGPGSHHDLALVQATVDAGEAPAWRMAHGRVGVNHFAVCYPTRESWLAQLEHLQAKDVAFLVRGNHGMSHSVYVADPDGNGVEVLYELPAEVWEGDLNAALNHFEPLERTGPDALLDDTDYPVFGR